MPTLAAFIAEPARQRGAQPRDDIREPGWTLRKSGASSPGTSSARGGAAWLTESSRTCLMRFLTAVADLDLTLHGFGPRRAFPEFRSDLQRPNG